MQLYEAEGRAANSLIGRGSTREIKPAAETDGGDYPLVAAVSVRCPE